MSAQPFRDPIVQQQDPGPPGRRPLWIRLLDQIVPSMITALVMGVVGYKILEYKVDALTVRDEAQQVHLRVHGEQITRLEERTAAAAAVVAGALQRVDVTFDRMDDRIRRMEISGGKSPP